MKGHLFFIGLFLTAMVSFGQTDPDHVPRPPAEKLKIFAPYFGSYRQTMTYAGIKWKGTMEIKPIIKGWYVDWTIFTTSEDNRIDREYHMLATYDTTQNRYRIWRFETLPPNNNEVTLRTEGGDIILEMKLPPSEEFKGQSAIFYNRYSKPSDDEIRIVSQLRAADGTVLEQIGTTTATRIK